MLSNNKYFLILGSLVSSTATYAQNTEVSAVLAVGSDKSSDLAIITNLLKTGQQLLYYGVGPLVGTGLLINGVKDVAKAERGEKTPGVVKIVCGVSCFGLIPIVDMVINGFFK